MVGMKKALALLLGFCLTLMLGGCFSVSGDDLLALPRQPKDYLQLQSQIDKLTSAGARFASPVSGANRQAVQTIDLTGDGQEEALVFMRPSADQEPNIYIFKKDGDSYAPWFTIEGNGQAIDSITYLDLTGSGALDIIVGWQVGGGVLKALTIYALLDGAAELLLSDTFSGYAISDINSDGVLDVVLIKHDAAGQTGVAELFVYADRRLALVTQAELSSNVEAIQRVKTGQLSDGAPAVFVASQYESTGLVTDVFTLINDTFVNISLNPGTKLSEETVRTLLVYAMDINHDNVIDIPRPVSLPPVDTGEDATTEQFWRIDWRNYASSGLVNRVMSTYHNFSDGWYFTLPETWEDRLTIARRDISASERRVVFYLQSLTGQGLEEVLSIYTLTGDSRAELAEKPGRFVVLIHTDMIIAAEVIGPYPISQQDVLAQTMWIQKEWISGELTTT